MDCKFIITDHAYDKELYRRFGSNVTRAQLVWSEAVEGNEFKPGFLEYLEKKGIIVGSLNETTDTKIVDEMIEYRKASHPDGNDTALDNNDNDASSSYGGASNRQFCIARTAEIINDEFRKIRYEEGNFDKISKEEYINRAKLHLLNVLLQRVQKGRVIPRNVFDTLDTQKLVATINQLSTALGENKTEQDNVLIALCTEAIVNDEKFFNEVFKSAILQSVTKEFAKDSADDDNADNDSDDADSYNSEHKEDNIDNSVDLSFIVYDSHSGQYGTFVTHVGENLNSYFNSLHKCTSTNRVGENEYDWNKDNCVGISECFTASECASILYSRSYNSVNEFIDEVLKIAEQVPGFEGFIQFYDDLKKNNDFAYECYSTFNKFVTSKKEVFKNENGIQVRITNKATTRVDALIQQYLNSIRTTSMQLDTIYIDNRLKELNSINEGFDAARSVNSEYNKADVLDAANILSKCYSHILPHASESVIKNFITKYEQKGKVDEYENIKTLVKHLDSLVNAAKKIAPELNNLHESIQKAINHNNKLKEESFKETYISEDKYIDLSTLYAKDPANENSAVLIHIAKLLAPYSTVKTENNSRNAAGNLSSDVVNNSMISYLKSILTSELNSDLNSDSAPINRYRDYKFRGKQYDLSNILIERVEGGEIVNFGLFRIDNGKYIPTEYFEKLLNFSQFNGINDTTSGKNALYSDCTLNDYFATAFVAYMRSNDVIDLNTKGEILLGSYLMRTPSDKPGNYFFTAPKYDTSTLLIFKDENAHNANIIREISKIPSITKEQAKSIIDIDKINENNLFEMKEEDKVSPTIEISSSKLVNVLLGESIDLYNVNAKQLKADKDSNKAYAVVSKDGVNVYVIGTVNNKGKGLSLTDCKIVGLASSINLNNSELGKELKSRIEKNLIDKKVPGSEKVINRNHRVFKQFRNQFAKEMQEAAIAINKLFISKDGEILSTTNLAEAIEKQGDLKDYLYDIYHWTNKTLVDNYAPGKARLTGKVFTSNKFTVFKNGKFVNYMDEVFSEDIVDENSEDVSKINFLYGGASCLHINENDEVYFTDNQQETIDNAIEKFLIDYRESTIDRAGRFEEILNEVDVFDEDAIFEFALNYRLAYYASDDLFEGNTKFYKSTQDFLKRAKEAQAGGIPYAIYDITKNMNGERVLLENKYSHLNSASIQERLKDLNDCKQYSAFRGITVNNTVRTDKEGIANIRKLLIDRFKKENKFITDKEAEERADEIVSGYEDIKTNDAQSYITFEEWIRRVAGRGQLAKYMPLIEKILDESQELSSSDIKQFIQVQKNFYYDMQFDEHCGVMVPRQIKNAEFVLVPRLIKGTELEAVYNAMIKAGIDQLNTRETSKAGKSGILDLWDNNGKLTQKAIDNFVSKASSMRKIYDYNFLYTQQETPQHLGETAENKFGLQISKKVLDNIDKNSPLYKHKENIQNCLCANIRESWANLMKDLGVDLSEDGLTMETDDKGNIVIKGLNQQSILEKLEQEMIRTGMDSNLADYVTPVNGTTNFDTLMPLYCSTLNDKVESICQSVFNRNITRQKLPGFHGAQITRIGFKNWKGNKGYPKELRHVVNEKENYMEVLLPYSAFGINPNDDQWSKYKTKVEKDEAILESIKDLSTVIGYRIPTEAKMSSQVMKVVGFIPSEYGSTIVVPDDWVATTGSDFDIDSVYGIQYKQYTDKNGNKHKVKFITDDKQLYVNYVRKNLSKDSLKKFKDEIKLEDYEIEEAKSEGFTIKEKALSQAFDSAVYYAKKENLMSFDEHKKLSLIERNSKDARNNFMLDNMISILQHNDSLIEMVSQSGFRNIVGENGAVTHVLGNNSEIAQQRTTRSCYDFFDQAEGFEDASAGMALKGFSVSADTFASVCNTVKPILKNGVKVIYDGNKYNIEELIHRYGEDNVKSLSDGNIEVTHTTFGHSSDNKNVAGQLILSYSAQTTAHILDAIKEGAVPNVSIDTFSVYKFLPTLGVDFDTTVAFMMQPAVSNIVSRINKTKSVYISSYAKPVDDTIKYYNKAIATELGIKESEVDKYIKDNYSNVNVLNYKELKKRFNNIDSHHVEKIIKHNTYNDLISANDDSIFVFGSNPLGINGNPSKGTGGAALVALQQGRVQQGEKMDNTISSNGRAYGLTTVKAPNARHNIKNQLSIEEITNNIKKLYAYALTNPYKTFKIAYTDTKLLNGHNISELVNAFINAGPIPNNILFHSSLDKYFIKSPDKVKQLSFDYLVAQKYKELNNYATQITQFTMVCNPDKFGAKQTIYATMKVFDDIQKIINSESIFTENILTKIYPDVHLGLNGYLASKNNKSAYPSLHHYLKYATATSIKINSMLFPTHSDSFEAAVKSITSVMKGENPSLTEETYTSFSKYILAYAYNQSNIISKPVTYVKGQGIMNVEGEPFDERQRIFGYNRRSDISFKNKEGQYEVYTCKNINEPTKDEIENFAKLTPAQKVAYCKKVFDDSLICKYLNTQTFNSAKYRANVAGSQTISFIEDTTNIETIYEEFRKTYENTNPLLALTAMDLIKYSVIVEGFRTQQHAVGKVISNKVLYTEHGLRGCGFIQDVKATVNSMADNFNSSLALELQHNYVRSHPDMKELAKTFIDNSKKENQNRFIAKESIHIINVNNVDNKSWLTEHNFGYMKSVPDTLTGAKKSVFTANPYIRVQYKGNPNKILYKILYDEASGYLYMYPLNKLQSNESAVLSVNGENNRYMPEMYFEAIIQDYMQGDGTYVETHKEELEAAKKAVKESAKKLNIRIEENTPFDINHPDFDRLRERIADHFDGTTNEWLYLPYPKLERYIKQGAIANPTTGEIIDNGQTITVNGNQYRIWKPANTKRFYKYLANEKAKTKLILDSDKLFTDIINWGRANNFKDITPYIVRPATTKAASLMHSSITEEISKSDRDLRRLARQGDEDAKRYISQVNKKDIKTNADVSTNLSEVVISTSEYVNTSVESLLNGENSFNYFVKDVETGNWISVTDPKALDYIKNDSVLRRKLIKLLLDANHLIETYKQFNTFTYSDEQADMKYYVNKITEAIRKLEDSNLLKDAEKLYVDGYLTSISNNPNIKNNIQSLYDGFYITSAMNSWFNDLQETGNPLLQIITSDVMKDIRAKELQGDARANEYLKYIEDLEKEAARNGKSINWDHIVTDSGTWINEYNDKFVEDLTSKRQTKDEAYKAYKDIEDKPENILAKSKAFNDYLLAKLEYNKFVNKHVHQELLPEYYKAMNDLEESMINPNTHKFYEVYVEYAMLNDKLKDIFSHSSGGTLDAYWESQRQAVTKQIRTLRSNVYINELGEYEYKTNLEDQSVETDPIKYRQQILNTLDAAERLDEYCKQRNNINTTYNTYEERFGFKEQLDKYLAIVKEYEAKDPITGKIIRSATELENNETYKKAKDWIYRNTLHKYSFNKEADAMTKQESLDILLSVYNETATEEQLKSQVAAAIKYFRNTAGTRADKKATYKYIGKIAEAYDEFGVFDATKLSDKQIEAIKAEQERRYGVGEERANSEKRIIHTASGDDTVYTKEFWDKLTPNGMTNMEYINICTAINSILRTVLNSSTGVVETSKLTEDQLDKLLVEFKKLGYNPISREFNTRDGIKKHKGVSRHEATVIQNFIKNNTQFVLNAAEEEKFNIEKANAELKGDDYYALWQSINMEYNEETNSFIPNHLLWGHIEPKDVVKERYTDKIKTAALRVLRNNFVETPSKYYEQKRNQMLKDYGEKSTEYKEWFERNHIYNPATHTIEPIVCWMTSEPADNSGEYEPSYNMTDKTPKSEWINKDYTPNVGYRANYKSKKDRDRLKREYIQRSSTNVLESTPSTNDVIPSEEYDNNDNQANEYENRLKNYVQELLTNLAKTKEAKEYLAKGNLPSKRRKESIEGGKGWLKEIAKSFGYIEGSFGNNGWHTMDYSHDVVPTMPMLSQLTDKESINKPNRLEFGDDIEGYEKALAEYEEKEDEIKKKNAEIHKALLDKDYKSVIAEFIKKAAHYNAIQDNKYSLYFAQDMLNRMEMYSSNRFGVGNFIPDNVNSDNTVSYKTQQDKNLQEQFDVWLHRLIYDEYKKPQGKANAITALMQSITSTMYMTVNLKGGIANVTVGEANILGEAFAKEYFGTEEWLAGKAIYNKGLFGYARDAYNETSTNLQDAIIKALHVVDYDEFRGFTSVADVEEYTQRLRDAAYCCQTAGEHFMQNSAMFSMMLSHRLVLNPDYGKAGEPKYKLMNFEEFVADADVKALKKICTDAEFEHYQRFVQNIKKDANRNKDYAMFKSYAVQDFIKKYLRDKAKAFNDARKEYRKAKKEEFKNYDDFYSQFDLSDSGKMIFKQGSKMEEMDNLTQDKEVSDAYVTLAKFKQRVISVNKKIHGNYGKLDAAAIEHQWFGGLVMQYHKHIFPGMMKRWRTKGYFNEERGTIEKGSYISLYEFLTAPLRDMAKDSNVSDGEVSALEGVQNILKNATDFFMYCKLNWHTMPENEKANCKRAALDIAGMLVALTLATITRAAGDDDDDSLAYNLSLYEADRLYSEINMWNPIGAINEIKTLYSSPLAAQSWITDGLKVMDNLVSMITQGEDYESNFHTGRYAGQSKLKVYVERRIPYWRNYIALRDLGENNRYYKRTSSYIDTVPKAISDWIKK